MARLAGAIAYSCGARNFEERLAEYLESPDDNSDATKIRERERRCRRFSRHLAESFLAIYREWPVDLPRADRRLWRVTRNRSAEAAVQKSALIVKADAARLLFEVSCEKITWAVVDGGIDHRHPAFLRHGLALPWDGQPGDDDRLAGKEPAENTPPPTRIRKTFDFTRLRDLLDPDVIASDSPERKELMKILERRRAADGEASAGAGDTGSNKEEIAARIEDRRNRIEAGLDVDWGLLEYFIEDKNPERPRTEHGTHVAGVLGADWRREEDPEKIVMQGICPDIRLMDLRVLRDDGKSDEFEVMAAVQYLRYRNQRAGYMDVHGANLSLSIQHQVAHYACGRTPICEECEEAVALGMVVVAAAGNRGFVKYQQADGTPLDGYNTVSITDPGNAEAVITVGSTHRTRPYEYGVSYFSSRGPTGDGRCKPDLVAPGEKIKAPVPGGDNAYKDGTSMAAPHVSGASALLMTRHRELIAKPVRIKEILCQTATDLGRERYFQGAGLLDILRALQSL